MTAREASRRRWAVVAAVMVLAIGCGGDSDTGSDAGEPTSGVPAPTTSVTTAPSIPVPAVGRADLDAFGQELLVETGATGGIVAVTRGGQPPVVAAVGTTPPVDGAPGEPITADAPLYVASITKSYVAALALVLAADGVIDLDVPIDRWSDWPGGDEITLRQLLDHTSGLGPFGGGEQPSAYFALVARGEPVTLEEALAAARDTPPRAEPGAEGRYSNLNYLVAGSVIEAAAGATLDDLLRARIFEPLGLDATWYPPARPDDDLPPPGLYELEPGSPTISTSTLPMEAWQTVAAPAAGAVSDLDDLLIWAEVVFRDADLGGVDLQEMTTIGPGGAGLGVIGVTADGDCIFDGCPPGARFDRWAINGDMPGSSTRLLHDPTSDTTLFVYLNRNALSLDAPLIAFLDELA